MVVDVDELPEVQCVEHAGVVATHHTLRSAL